MVRVVKMVFIISCLMVAITKGWGQDLIVFTSKDTSISVVKDFNETVLPQLAEVAKNTESNLKVLFLENGIPEEIKFLPSIYYVNGRSKSIYKSAYGSTQRIKTFILQSKVFESGYQPFVKENLFCSNINDFEQGINLKITPLSGVSSNLDSLVDEKILSGLKANVSGFHFEGLHVFNGVNKQFFLNVYPYLNDKGTYYLSYEIFSQNNCHAPIVNAQNNPVVGKTIEEASEKLAVRINESWEDVLGDTMHQDGVFIITEMHEVKTWGTLGYVFKQEEESIQESSLVLPHGSFALEKQRLIIFTFAPPADAYSGLIQNFNGEFKFANGKLQGEFVAQLKSLDSGDEDLNNSILSNQFDVEKNPRAKIVFNADINEVKFNEPVLIPAQLFFLNQQIDIELETVFSSADKAINFWVNTDFTLNISSFEELEKPHYEAPINEEVHVHITFKGHNLVD